MLIEWKEEYNFGIQKIDEQHQNLVNMMNRVYELIEKRKFGDEMKGLLEELTIYTVEHLDLEEKYFDEFNFEFKESHKQKHDVFEEKIKELKRMYGEEGVIASFDLIDYLEDWFLEHVTREDRKYVQLFKENGLS